MAKKSVLPPWMKNDIIYLTENDEDSGSAPKRRLRSNFSFGGDQENTRPPTPPSSYPFIEYTGKIVYITDWYEIAATCEELLQWVERQPKDERIPIAFDMEWPFSFQTGPGKTSLIQLCADVSVCYLFHVFEMNKLPASLVVLLKHQNVVLHGVNIVNDFRKLERDFPTVKTQQMIDQCRDLSTFCNEVLDTRQRWSMERLVLEICRLRINKDKKVRMSKWHISPLNENQQLYAAIDVYISQKIFYELKERQTKKQKDLALFEANYSEETIQILERLA